MLSSIDRMLNATGAAVLPGAIGVAAVFGCIRRLFLYAMKRNCWPRTVREVLARQLLFTGLDAVPLILLLASLAGISVVAQAQVWLSRLGQSEMLGPLLVIVLFREFGPLLVNFVVIGRSGTAIATELANMKVNGEIRALEAQGIDPDVYLVMPRVIGMMLSIFCLTVIFAFASVAVGYLAAVLFQVSSSGPAAYFADFLGNLTPGDFVSLAVKTMVPGLLAGAISCYEGMNVAGSVNEVPRAATHAVVRSISALITVTALVAIITYLK